MKIIKIAGPADKVAKFKITDPHLVFLVYAYETLIDWNKVKNQQDIIQFVETNLMPTLHQMIDPNSKNNFYMKEISDENIENQFAAYPNDQVLQGIAKIYKTDKETAKQKFMEGVNNDKQEKFFDWWDFFRQENPTYKSNPSFSFCMLKRIFETSPSNKKQSVTSLDPEVIQSLYASITQNPKNAINLEKTYTKGLGEKNAKGMQKRDLTKNEGWVYLPRASIDPEHFEERVKKLHDFSVDNGWCTGTGNERPYLTRGDFHLFVQNNVAKVAIRMDGDKKILEIRAKQNYPAVDFWEETLRYIREKSFITDQGAYQTNPATELEEAEKINKQLRDDPEYVKEFRKRLINDLDLYKQLSIENKKLFTPEAADGWTKKINYEYGRYQAGFTQSYEVENLKDFFDVCPPEVARVIEKDHPDILPKVVDFWMKQLQVNPEKNLLAMPNRVKRRLPVGFEAKVWNGYLQTIMNNPKESYKLRDTYMRCPDIIRKDIPVETKRVVTQMWVSHLSHDKRSYKELNQCPQEIKDLMTPEELDQPRQKMIKLIDETPNYYDRDMPAEIFDYLPPDTRLKVRQHWGKIVYESPKKFESCPDEIRKTFKPDFEIKAWVRYLEASIERGEERLYRGKWVPDYIKKQLPEEIKSHAIQFYEKHAITNPIRIMQDTPPEVLAKFSDETCKQIADKIMPYITDYPDFIDSLPKRITDYLSKDAEDEMWRKKLAENPSELISVPERMRERITNNFMVQVWMKKIMSNAVKTNECPPEFLSQIPTNWLINVWARHLRANPLDYKACRDDIKQQIPQATKEIIARSFANILRTIPINRDYYIEQFGTNWIRDPEILRLLPDDIKNKLRRVNIPFLNNILGQLPQQPQKPQAPKRANTWYNEYLIKKS